MHFREFFSMFLTCPGLLKGRSAYIPVLNEEEKEGGREDGKKEGEGGK